jgi:hypothetical protein
MEGRKPQSSVMVQRAFAQARLSDDLLAQAYDHVLHGVPQAATVQETRATRPTRRRQRVSRVTTTGGR